MHDDSKLERKKKLAIDTTKAIIHYKISKKSAIDAKIDANNNKWLKIKQNQVIAR